MALYEVAVQTTNAQPASVNLSLLFELNVPAQVNAVYPIDLFEVQSELRSSINHQSTGDDTFDKITDSRHSTLRDIVVATQNGLHVIDLDFDAESGKPIAKLIESGASNLPTAGNVDQIASLDIEGDGDLDLVAVIDSRIRIFENRGLVTFSKPMISATSHQMLVQLTASAAAITTAMSMWT